MKSKSLHSLAKDFGFLVCLGLSLILLISSLSSSQGLTKTRTVISDTVVPVVVTFVQPVNNIIESIRDMAGLTQLQAMNDRLSQENEKLRLWYQTALRLEAENKSLKSMLNVTIDHKYDYITTNVLMDTGRDFAKSVLVATDSGDGLREGQAVVGNSGLIGRIAEVGRDSARVLLITDANSRVPILIENSNQHAILAGDNSDMPVLKHLPQNSTLVAGAKVMTSGYAGVFPKGLPIGTITIEKDGARVRLFSDMNALSHVRIVKDKKSIIRTKE